MSFKPKFNCKAREKGETWALPLSHSSWPYHVHECECRQQSADALPSWVGQDVVWLYAPGPVSWESGTALPQRHQDVTAQKQAAPLLSEALRGLHPGLSHQQILILWINTPIFLYPFPDERKIPVLYPPCWMHVRNLPEAVSCTHTKMA